MKLKNDICISKNRQGEYWSNIEGQWKQYSDINELAIIIELYQTFKRKNVSEAVKLQHLIDAKTKLCNNNLMQDEETLKLKAEQNRVKLEGALNKLIDFFSEFSFEPNFRFVNTFSRLCSYATLDDAKAYINNYFALTDNAYAASINEKMKSLEFQEILDVFKDTPTQKTINKRFKLYYGSQGTGKTTAAMIEANKNCMVCHSAMLPSDLMEDFKFDNGKATFTPSALCKAMTNGEIIVLDEINLLPFESLRFLQSILDDKTQFEYKGQTINIADGFKIIGTMNLQVNSSTYALPEPLVDRAEELKKFTLTADKLMSAVL